MHLTQYKPIWFNQNQMEIVVKSEKLLIRVYSLGVHVFGATFTSNSLLKKAKEQRNLKSLVVPYVNEENLEPASFPMPSKSIIKRF